MARIVDKDTRLIDIDFGPVASVLTRNPGDQSPIAAQSALNGTQQMLYFAEPPSNLAGSFIQYQSIDLSMMTMNNEVMQPIDVSVQRTSPVPLGNNNNGNNFDQIEEYIYVFTRPLLNARWRDISKPSFDEMRELGLDRSQTATEIGGEGTGIPNHAQTVYAEKRMYSYNSNLGATIANGELDPLGPSFNSLYGMPSLDSVTTWGSMSAITGPQLHCYRVIINRTQYLPFIDLLNVPLAGDSTLRFPPVNITLLCKDPNYTEGEYLTRLANAMNNIPEDGPTA
jgi:hypothetical protein